MESGNKQKINGTSYNIISYDQLNLDLLRITQKVVTDFLSLFEVHASIQTLEGYGSDELVSQWKTLEDGYCNVGDNAFCSKVEKLYNKAVSKLQPFKVHKGILVTTMRIGTIVGVWYNWIGTEIISSYQISNHRETFETAVFHELGHMHGAPSCYERKKLDKRASNDSQIVAMEKEQRETNAIYECLGEHCLNIGCSMRQRLCFANWRLHLTKERL